MKGQGKKETLSPRFYMLLATVIVGGHLVEITELYILSSHLFEY
jgi:hypothetical protein